MAYRTIPGVDTDLTSIDIHPPASPVCDAPVVMWVHGGGYQTGDKSNRIRDKVTLFNDAGWILVSVNYRLTAPGQVASAEFPDHYDDVAAAVAWVHEHIGSYGGDATRIALLGHSAGADIVANVVTNPTYLDAVGLGLPAVRCAGPLDTEGFDKTAANASDPDGERELWAAALGNNPDYATDTSATLLIEPDIGIPPMIGVVRGSPQRQQIETAFLDTLAANGIEATTIDARSLTHAAVNANIGAPDDTVMTAPLMTFLTDCLTQEPGDGTATIETTAPTAPTTAEVALWPSLPATTYDVVVTEDIVYGQGEVDGGGSFVDLLLDLYMPQDTGQAELPLVVVVHGGGFRGGSKTQGNVVDWAQGFASRGYLVASIDYRLSGMDPVPSSRVQPMVDAFVALGGTVQEMAAIAAIDDTLTALDFLIARPDTVDTMTTLVGGSAGAVTVDYVAYALDDFGIERPPVAALVSNWGGLPVGGSAATFVDNPAPSGEPPYTEPPVYLAHATGDTTVPYSLSTDIAAQASAVGLDHELYTKDADAHAFDLTSNVVASGVSVLDDQVTWVTCRLYPHLAGAPECA
ncbi:MAG: alpha/beta hydrolase [Actinobacteria bacterium]|nr:alpha/beta hydrolase [Actinomycetota bacterium]